jgi:TPP-dependent pyruvate/acetoin dehydrogenase alpha subunit
MGGVNALMAREHTIIAASASSHRMSAPLSCFLCCCRMDGMNVLMVREGMKKAKEWCSTGNGPIYVEVSPTKVKVYSYLALGVYVRQA